MSLQHEALTLIYATSLTNILYIPSTSNECSFNSQARQGKVVKNKMIRYSIGSGVDFSI